MREFHRVSDSPEGTNCQILRHFKLQASSKLNGDCV